MTVRPFMKFFCADWRADPRLRMCSLAARGLWIDLISYMHEGEPYGHLTIDGVIPDIDGIAALVAAPLRDVRKALDELEQKKIFSRSKAGAIFSRRMVRDHEKAEKDKANGKGGGNPRLKGVDKEGVNPTVKGGDKAHIPDSTSREEIKPADAVTPMYAFESGVIRLTQKDFDNWRESFPKLDLRAELLSLTEWASTQPKWFFAVSGALAKRNRDIGIRLSAAQRRAPLTADGQPWPEGIT